MGRIKIVVATLKSWNIKNYKKLKRRFPQIHFKLIKSPEKLTAKQLNKIKPKYIFLPHWSSIINSEIYENYSCIIFHMTDLPFGKGGSPLQNLIINGIKSTKISTIKAAKKLDSGDIYCKSAPLDISKNSAHKIYKKASRIIFSELIPFIINHDPTPIAQNGEVATEFKRRTPQMSDLAKFCSDNSPKMDRIYDFIRMLDAPTYPKAFIDLSGFKAELKGVKRRKNRLKGKFKIYEK